VEVEERVLRGLGRELQRAADAAAVAVAPGVAAVLDEDRLNRAGERRVVEVQCRSAARRGGRRHRRRAAEQRARQDAPRPVTSERLPLSIPHVVHARNAPRSWMPCSIGLCPSPPDAARRGRRRARERAEAMAHAPRCGEGSAVKGKSRATVGAKLAARCERARSRRIVLGGRGTRDVAPRARRNSGDARCNRPRPAVPPTFRRCGPRTSARRSARA